MKIKKNQVIASEGVMPYYEDGKIVYKLKTWGNLKDFAQTNAPVVDGHPPEKLMTTATPTFGGMSTKECAAGKRILCADVAIDENAPDRAGYSIGYTYDEVAQEGDFEGQHYDRVQTITAIDHLALTDTPRNQAAIATDEMKGVGTCSTATLHVGGDATDKKDVVKYLVAYDSIITFKTPNQRDTNMPIDEKTAKIIADLQAENDAFKLSEATQKAEGDVEVRLAKKDQEIAAEKAKTKIANDALAVHAVKEEKEQLKRMKEASDYIQSRGISGDAIKGENWDFMRGAVAGLKYNQPAASRTAVDGRGGDSIGEDSSIDFVFNGKEWVKR